MSSLLRKFTFCQRLSTQCPTQCQACRSWILMDFMMFALTYLLKGRRQALVGLLVIACTLVQDTSKAAGWHNLPHIQNWTLSFEEKTPWYNCARLFAPCRRSRHDSRLDLRSHIDWWARKRLIELRHKSADRMSEAEKELKFGSWRWELAHDRSGKEMIWGDCGPSERDFSPPTSLKEKWALSCSIYHVSSIPLAAIFLSRHKVKVAQTHWSRWPEALASSPGHLRRQAVCVQLPWSTLLLQWCILSLVCSICWTSHSFFSLHPLIRLCLPWPCLFLTRANVDGSFLLPPIAGFDDIITERRQQVCHTSPQTKTV